MMLQQITWDVSPIIVKLGGLQIRWYGLFFAMAFYFGYIILEKQVFRREGLKTEMLDKLAMYVVVGTIVGARLGHVFFYEPESYVVLPTRGMRVFSFRTTATPMMWALYRS